MQTILGAGGAIGTPLASALAEYTSDIRLVSRNPQKIHATDTLMPADLTDPAAIDRAVAGSEIVYVTVGFPYKLSIWQQSWVPFITQVIQSCQVHDAKLVFFDNVYAIDAAHLNPITEQSPMNPSSRKGTVRMEVDQLIIQAIEQGKIQAIIARAPDFYGVKKETSMLMNLVYDNIKKGKRAQWLCNADTYLWIHTRSNSWYSYTR
jgi:nucleoside-diphosphate-sugar epimerase